MHFASLRATLLIFTLSTSGCVTTHRGDLTLNKKQQYGISCAKNPNVDAKHFLLVTCTIENSTAQWLNVKFESFELQGGSTKLSTPEEIAAFDESYQYKSEQDGYNNALLLSSLVVTGAVLSASSGNPTVRSAGTVAAISSGVALTARKVDGVRNSVSHAYGSQHLLGQVLKIPPEMFTRRSVVLEITKKTLPSDTATICTSAPEKECMNVAVHLGRSHRNHFEESTTTKILKEK